MARKELRDPIEGVMKMMKPISKIIKNLIFLGKENAIPKSSGKNADKKAPNAFGSLNVEFDCPSVVQKGVLPRRNDQYFWSKEKPKEIPVERKRATNNLRARALVLMTLKRIRRNNIPVK